MYTQFVNTLSTFNVHKRQPEQAGTRAGTIFQRVATALMIYGAAARLANMRPFCLLALRRVSCEFSTSAAAVANARGTCIWEILWVRLLKLNVVCVMVGLLCVANCHLTNPVYTREWCVVWCVRWNFRFSNMAASEPERILTGREPEWMSHEMITTLSNIPCKTIAALDEKLIIISTCFVIPAPNEHGFRKPRYSVYRSQFTHTRTLLATATAQDPRGNDLSCSCALLCGCVLPVGRRCNMCCAPMHHSQAS